jgi:hypothetical protein
LKLKRSGWIGFRHRQLDTSNGCRNHTLLPYATTRLRQKASPGKASFVCAPRIAHGRPPCDHLARRRCRVHRISTRVRDDRDTPLLSGETDRVVEMICPTGPAEYF